MRRPLARRARAGAQVGAVRVRAARGCQDAASRSLCLEVSGAQVGWRSLEVTARRPQPSVPSADLSPAWGTHKGGSLISLVLGGRLLLSHGDTSHVGKALGFSWTEGQMTLGQSRASFPQQKMAGGEKGHRGQHQRVREKEAPASGAAGAGRDRVAPRGGREVGEAFVVPL